MDAFFGLAAGTANGTMSLVTSVLTTVFLLAFVIFTTRFMRKHVDDLEKKDFKASYGTLYQNVETYKKPEGLFFTPLFCVRRLIFAFTIVFLD